MTLVGVWSWLWLPVLCLAASLVGVATALARSLVATILYRGARLARPTCRRCGSHVRGEGERIAERCPECGNETTRDHAITIVGLERASVQRIAALVLSAGATVLGLVATTLLLIAVQGTLPEKIPQWQMAGQEEEWQRLWRRFHLDQELVVAESDVIWEEFRQWIHEEREALARTSDGGPGRDVGRERPLGFVGLAAELVRRGLVSNEEMARELAPLLPPPSFAMTPRATPGSRVWIHASFPGAAGCRAAFELGEVHIAANQTESPAGRSIDTSADAYANGNVIASAWFFDAPLDPGTYEVTFEVDARWEPYPEVRFPALSADGEGSAGSYRLTRTLEVVGGAEELPRVDDLARTPFARILGGRHLAIRSTEAFGGHRDHAWMRILMSDLRLDGEWSLDVSGTSTALVANPEVTPWTQGTASRIIDRPAGGWPERLAVRYTPTDATVVARATRPTPTAKPRPNGRHQEGVWAVPTTLTFRRVPSADSNELVYEVESVETHRSR